LFEAAEIDQPFSADDYEREIESLRVDLLNAQFEMQEADFPVLIVLSGVDRATCASAHKSMHQWMDQRHIETHTLGALNHGKNPWPEFFTYWGALPRAGRMGVFLDAWPEHVIRDAVELGEQEAHFERRVKHIRGFERELTSAGGLVLKYWFHIRRGELGARLKKAKKDPEGNWWIGKEDRALHESYTQFTELAEKLIRQTSTDDATWQVIGSANPYFAHLSFARDILDRLRRRLDNHAPPPPSPAPSQSEPIAGTRTLLHGVDLSRKVAKKTYEDELTALQSELSRLTRRAHKKGQASVLVFEGWDAAGKGGLIRRLTWPIDSRHFEVVPVGAPTEEELAHHYLWRFWRRVPAAGHATIFDRSWYGRVLVERVESLASEAEWRRAYLEILDFEAQLTDAGILVQKFFLHIDPDEQAKRFQARENTPYKKYKITAEDYRNRESWPAYEDAINEMVERTHVSDAPWHLIAANDKKAARLEVLGIFVDQLEKRL
jgi:polyphosphate:AMP phosphotransferase